MPSCGWVVSSMKYSDCAGVTGIPVTRAHPGLEWQRIYKSYSRWVRWELIPSVVNANKIKIPPREMLTPHPHPEVSQRSIRTCQQVQNSRTGLDSSMTLTMAFWLLLWVDISDGASTFPGSFSIFLQQRCTIACPILFTSCRKSANSKSLWVRIWLSSRFCNLWVGPKVSW